MQLENSKYVCSTCCELLNGFRKGDIIDIGNQKYGIKLHVYAQLCIVEVKKPARCQASIINYLIKEICTLCKLRSQGMLGPVYPEISSEGLKQAAKHSMSLRQADKDKRNRVT